MPKIAKILWGITMVLWAVIIWYDYTYNLKINYMYIVLLSMWLVYFITTKEDKKDKKRK